MPQTLRTSTASSTLCNFKDPLDASSGANSILLDVVFRAIGFWGLLMSVRTWPLEFTGGGWKWVCPT